MGLHIGVRVEIRRGPVHAPEVQLDAAAIVNPGAAHVVRSAAVSTTGWAEDAGTI
jgi:hypothetical protein